ncbi:specifically androgen-regulated gene protein-like [Anarhichas minor]|uniref:specifically androgen-regulated gene protein-like n=1 Tax=Anarhichas minor TaxID=65739 RepID=UPI003F739365
MPKSDTWPGGVAMESLSKVDSAGSCDSVISMNSGYSQDSMEHLSPEERACLMYFEETIEALEVQEDSGFSNDEPDPAFQAGTGVNGVPSLKSDVSGKDQTTEPGSRVFSIEDRAEHHALSQTSEPQSSTESAADGKISPSSSQLCVSKDEDGHLQIVPIASLCPDQSNEASEIDVDVIPPPSDFMDEPGLPSQTQNVKDLPPSARIYHDEPGATVDLEQLRQRAFSKKTSVTQDPLNQPPKLSLPALSPGLLMIPPPEAAEPRSPPAVAPKPKKLPANIILKSHKAAVAVSDDNSEHSVPTSRLDPQRVHIEALRKLGLLPAEADSGPTLSPSFSPKSRNSWAVPLSPISPRPPHTPPITPSYTSVNSSPPACVPLQSPAAASPSATSTAPAVQPAEVLPAPTGFSDSVGPPLSDNEPSVENASEATVNAQVSTPPHTPPALVKHLTPPKVVGVKSATLERSGLGLSSYMAGQDSTEAGSASRPRKNRARQASLGNQKDFASAGREGSPVGQTTSKEPELWRSLPHNVFQHSAGDSHKLPRSQGISVLICPRAENGGGRREALKKLGLLRD